ncbi:hypothetical protein [Pseudoduganella armeniaca]|uniref:hypothetical protein n=1 Tax=Pseudoduganella armeniaca TaxID=2072590 RepID=UPI0015E70442|nr:hypothetical protein [Pseudoduganella armeniaca]
MESNLADAVSGRISRVTLPDPTWRYVVLFQSWRQFISWGGWMGGTLSVVAVLVWLVGDIRLIPQISASGLLGGAWSLLFATRAQLAVRGVVRSEEAEVERVLHDCGYVEQTAVDQEKRFVQKLPAWLRWGESDVTIAVRGESLVCTGPQLVIRRMRRALRSFG